MKFLHVNSILQAKEAYKVIKDLGLYYPDFYSWYWNKVVPNIYLGVTTITLLIVDSKIIGVSIIKKSELESKLCALRVTEQYKNKGYALYLIDYSLKLLNTDKPLCSVGEDLINHYSRIFINHYNFNISHVYKGIYQKNKLEYEFNGDVKLKITSPY